VLHILERWARNDLQYIFPANISSVIQIYKCVTSLPTWSSCIARPLGARPRRFVLWSKEYSPGNRDGHAWTRDGLVVLLYKGYGWSTVDSPPTCSSVSPPRLSPAHATLNDAHPSGLSTCQTCRFLVTTPSARFVLSKLCEIQFNARNKLGRRKPV
jgi:hypothetical protein